MRNIEEETIVAVSTAPGRAAIGIVRMSGEKSAYIARRIFRRGNGSSIESFQDRKLYYGSIIKGEREIDRGMVVFLRRPRSYTGEDLVELHCHGSPIIMRMVVEACIEHGARLAEPGEFTKRAFINGKIDLTQAEAVASMIEARTECALALAVEHLKGGLGAKIDYLLLKIVDLIAALEGGIDFPEEEVGVEIAGNIESTLKQLISESEDLLRSYRAGKTIRDGMKVVLIGRPNAGKSSIFNRLLEDERAIVSEEPGTTRDMIEGSIFFDGLEVRIFDTAGIIDAPVGPAAREGVRKSCEAVESSDLIIFVADSSRSWSEEDCRIADRLEGRIGIISCNKADLGGILDMSSAPRQIASWPSMRMSALSGEGIPELRRMLGVQCVKHVSGSKAESAVICSLRHASAVKECVEALRRSLAALNSSAYDEIIAMELRAAIESLEGITGKSVDEEVLRAIFSRFCIGK